MNSPMASPAAQSVLEMKPALVSALLTVGRMFSCDTGCSSPVFFPLNTSSLLLHEASSRPAVMTAERKKIVFMLKKN